MPVRPILRVGEDDKVRFYAAGKAGAERGIHADCNEPFVQFRKMRQNVLQRRACRNQKKLFPLAASPIFFNSAEQAYSAYVFADIALPQCAEAFERRSIDFFFAPAALNLRLVDRKLRRVMLSVLFLRQNGSFTNFMTVSER